MTRSITFRAPTRLDFGGGWTDVPPYCDDMGGYVCNLAIRRYATVRLSEPDDGGRVRVDRTADRALVDASLRRFHAPHVDIALANDFPVGAGLGGSSAAGVALVAALLAWRGEQRSRHELAELSREVETAELGIAGGRQDHYAAAYGGALGLRFVDHTVQVERIALAGPTRAAIERRCLVIYTGESRISGDTITAVLNAYQAGDEKVRFALRRMRELAEQMPSQLASGDLDALGALVAEQWVHQRALHPAIPTARIDEIIERARRAGAAGAKALGASGGGCVLVIARDHTVDEVRTAIAPLGELLSFSIDDEGVASCA